MSYFYFPAPLVYLPPLPSFRFYPPLSPVVYFLSSLFSIPLLLLSILSFPSIYYYVLYFYPTLAVGRSPFDLTEGTNCAVYTQV
jgi:hypothetical protein